MSRIYFALLSISLLLTAGCCKKKLYCNPDGLTIVLVGYPRLDIRNIIVKKYAIGNHKKALDSTTFLYTGSEPLVINKKDTIVFTDYKTTSTTISGIYQGNDWDVYLPGTPARENYRITSIVDEEHRFEMIPCSDNDAKCLNPIGHLVVNDTWKKGDTLWIEKKK